MPYDRLELSPKAGVKKCYRKKLQKRVVTTQKKKNKGNLHNTCFRSMCFKNLLYITKNTSFKV